MAQYLSKELHTAIKIESLYLKPFKSMVLEGLYIQDLQKDTLLFAPKFTLDLNYFSLKKRRISVNNIQLDRGKFYLKDLKDKSTNLDFIINYFNTGKPEPKLKKKAKPYDITLDRITLNDVTFRYKNFRVDTVIDGINFDDILLSKLNGLFTGLDTKNHLAKLDVKHLTFKERSGFYLQNLTTNVVIDSNLMVFKNLQLNTPRTNISDFVQLSYHQFRDFGQFIEKVKFKAHLKKSILDPSDISYFSPEVRKIKLSINVDGEISGYVNNIKARNFLIKTAKATYLKGNFTIKGLPKISETFLDLDFDRVASNKKDADFIVSAVTGNKKSIIPDIVNKFGNFSFKGRFTGFINDFIAFGEFKTRLGKVISDVNMKISKVPVYTGTVRAVNFDLGELLGNNKLGRTSLIVKVNGKGFAIKQLTEKLESRISYIDFNNYRYKNVSVNGTFHQNLFTGKVKINDNNLKLNFDGSLNLNPKLPLFKFVASVDKANLHQLHFSKDTIKVRADFNTNFTGNNLDNIQGNLEIAAISITTPKNSFLVDSVRLNALGYGRERSLTINSDILDAGIKGQYDLNTLPSYFKTVVKRYIPSLNAKIVKPGNQNFDFQLKLKYFEPVAALLLPALKFPEGATITGKFESNKNTATLNGFAKTAEYNKIRINNLIIDGTTTDKELEIFVTSDQINLTDSLYIKNINIANILHNDSLSLNVKLSDKNANNQLDLNGLVQFKKDSAALFSILPSDIIINRETWKVQEQVRIGFLEGKTTIKNFELSQGSQLLKIDGIISSDPNDNLNATFNTFKLTTFNPLTQASGLDLNGILNGKIILSSVLKKPRLKSDLTVDSLNMNGTQVGDLDLKADYDNEAKLVNVNLNIKKQDLETVNVAGTYNATADKNTLDMAVKMDGSELIIFEPFLKRLVSNLKGKVSADLKLTGTPFSPRIDGSLKLLNAGMVVNYLKTPYTINDEISVENSVISLKDLTIKDVRNNTAIASGSVDMKNPNNPDINITINAQNFMALNTRVKDNSSYYGTAYGTGTFRFRGPTDNMHINIDAKTEEGTVFNIPLNSTEVVNEHEFITFVAKDTALTKKRESSFKGLVMNFDLAVDENSQVNIITDLGKLSGRGESEALNLKITSLGDFEMSGDFLISSGKFEFTAQDYINKVFDISQGGSIHWNKDPTHAKISLRAVYAVRTSVKPLYIAAGREIEDRRVLAEAVMDLKGDLLQPDINFDLNFPTDAYIKDELQGFLSDVNNKTQQAVSLIVRRSFSPNTGLNIQTVNSTIARAGTELVFNQFNNILAQSLNLNFVDLNIRSLNEASASVKLLNERLVFTYGVTDRRTELNDYNILGNSIARDVEALYLLRRDGSLVLRASNKLNNRSVLANYQGNNEYVSALGLVYRQEFDSPKEFIRAFIGKNRREERKKDKTVNPVKVDALRPDEIEIPAKQ